MLYTECQLLCGPNLDTETPQDVSPSCWGENSVVNYA